MAVIKSVAVNELTRVCEREEKGREEMGSEENIRSTAESQGTPVCKGLSEGCASKQTCSLDQL